MTKEILITLFILYIIRISRKRQKKIIDLFNLLTTKSFKRELYELNYCIGALERK